MPKFEITEGSPQYKLFTSTAPIQLAAGGYGWGKTSLLCVKCIQIMQDYPNCHGAILRNTEPNLKTTTYQEFLKWCPKHLIAKYPSGNDKHLVFKNGSSVLFSYIKMNVRGDSKTMNLLSATFDFVFIDQLEDPEFTYDLFCDLQGRLRGTAKYVGNEDKPTYCNFIMCTTNPTQNWVCTKLVRPLKVWEKTGVVSEDLLKDEDLYQRTGEVKPIIDLIEGTTYDNAEHLPDGFISRLENMYKGARRRKYMLGEWDVGENLVYDMFIYAENVVDHERMLEHLKELKRDYTPGWREGFDYGVAKPSCYLLAFIDQYGVYNFIDGWYKAELSVREQAAMINEIREKFGVPSDSDVISDPALFRRSRTDVNTVAEEFAKWGVYLVRGNNNIAGGIARCGGMIQLSPGYNPYTGAALSPKVIISADLQFMIDEMVNYRWKQSRDGIMDVPNDKNDHAMDAMKYVLTYDEDKAKMVKKMIQFQQEIRQWRTM